MAESRQKKGTIKTVAIIALLLLIGKGYSMYNTAKLLQVKFAGISFGGNILSPEIYLKLFLTNVTDSSLTVQSITGSVYTQTGQKLADIFADQTLNLSAASTQQLVVKINPVISDLITTIKNIVNSPLQESFTFKGYVTAENIPLPVKATYSVKDFMNG